MKITHIITGLGTGGAEMMLYKLISRTDRAEFDIRVVSLTDIGEVGRRIQALGVPVAALGMRRTIPDPRVLFRLSAWLRREAPQVIQTWMYHADLLGGLAAKLAGSIPTVWGIRHSNLDPEANKRSSLWTAKGCALLSPILPTRIVCCSEAARSVHAAIGYANRKMVVIPNGFDLAAFQPAFAARADVRHELGTAQDTFLVGLVARFHPQKDHRNFVAAAGRLHELRPEVHYLLCGDQVTWENPELVRWIDEAGIRNNVHLLGRRDDIPRLTAALDIATSSSVGEGFPNAIGEAMACAIPCVVTDVGDSAYLVGDTGKVVAPRDPVALAQALASIVELPPEQRQHMGSTARLRVDTHFQLVDIVQRYADLYRDVAREPRR